VRHFLLFYEKVPDYAERQAPLLDAHRAYLQGVQGLLLGGNLGDPADGSAAILFAAESREVVERFAAGDPYVTGGVVARWSVRAWDTVVGSLANC